MLQAFPGFLQTRVGLRSVLRSMRMNEELNPDGTCVQALCVSLDMFCFTRVMMASQGNQDFQALR